MAMDTLRQPIKNPNISQLFGKDFLWYNPAKGITEWFYKDTYGMLGHPGLDYACPVGTPIYAAHAGVILYAGYDATNGNLVQVWNETGNYKTLYGHNSEFKVAQGDYVVAGQLISLSGDTGAGTGPHLHFGFKETKEGGNTKYPNNGYNGCIDPLPMLIKDYLGNDLIKNMTYKKIVGQPHIWMCNDEKKERTMVVDMPTLQVLNSGEFEEVSQLDLYEVKGTIVLVERIIE
jgi:murein DD-endopeptidase MepM/ murein hydrolase activator NlpD